MSKIKTALGLSYFNNVKELPRLLDPVYKHYDYIIAIDGRYPLFKWNSDKSTDGSTSLLQTRYPNAITYGYNRPVEQIEKRQKYLDIARDEGVDFVCVHDSDEYLYHGPEYQNDWDLFYKNLEKLPKEELLANMLIWIRPEWTKNYNMVSDNMWHLYTKIIRPEAIKYDTAHWIYTKRDDDSVFQYANVTVDGVRYDSDSLLRTKEYQKAGEKWAYEQMLEENARFESDAAKRKRMNFWINHLKQTLKLGAIPGTIEDNR